MTRPPFAMPLSRDSFGIPIDKPHGLWDALSQNIPGVLRMMKSKQRYLEGRWEVDATLVYCREEKLENANKWILDTLGLKQEPDLIDFLGAELIKYMQSARGRYDVDTVTSISIAVPMRDGDISHWMVDGIDFTRKCIYVRGADGKQSRYDVPQNITIKSTERIESLRTSWATLLKAIGLVFFLKGNGKAVFINKLNHANDKKVVYSLACSPLSIEIVGDRLTIQGNFSIQASMASIDDIFLEFWIEADKFKFLGNNNMNLANPYHYPYYYNPTRKIAIFVDAANNKVPIHVDVHGKKIRLMLDEQLWIGITRLHFGTHKSFAFALYVGSDNKLKDERCIMCVMNQDIVKYLFRRFGLIDAST